MRKANCLYPGILNISLLGLLLVSLSCGGQEGSFEEESGDDLAEKRALWTPVGLTGGGAMYMPSISPHDPNLILITCDMSGAYRTTDGGKTWEMLHFEHLLGSTRCRSVFDPQDPNVIYGAHGYRGSLRVSRDRGKTWSPLGAGLPSGLLDLAIDPAGAGLMLAGTREGVFRSEDSGQSWEKGAGFEGRSVGLHIEPGGSQEPRHCFAASTEGVFVSLDNGLNWEQTGEGLPQKALVDFVGGSSVDRSILYCTIESEIIDGQYVGGVYRSTDGGQTWAQAMGQGIDISEREFTRRGRTWTSVPSYTFVVANSVRPEVVYVAQRRPGQVYRSDDAGDSWRPTYFANPEEEGFNVEPSYSMAETGRGGSTASGLGIDPKNPETVVMTDWFKCQITRDGGKSWQTLHTRSSKPERFLEKGQEWVNNGLVVTSVWHYYIDPFERNRHYIAYTDVKFARSVDSGKTWISDFARPLRNTTYELAFDPEIPGKIWGAFADMHDIPNGNIIHGRHYRERSGGGVGISEDFAVSWKDTSEGLVEEPVTSIVLDPNSEKNARTLYAALFEAGVFKSVDDGKTWTNKSKGLGEPEKNMRACRLILHNDGTLFCLVTALKKDDEFQPEGPGLYRSRDGAESWEYLNESLPLLWPKDYDVDPRDSNVIYLGAADANQSREGGLYKTTDGGKTWQLIGREGPQTFGATIHPNRPDWVYMCLTESAPGSGLWLSKNGGDSWKQFRGIPFRNVQRVSFDSSDDTVIYVNTFGGSVWKGPAEE
jgi:photosystem II stability/assembly factor-like uncharacterized protein